MTLVRIKAAVVALLMVLAYAGANAWRPTQHLADSRPKVNLETIFPKAFGQWTVDERMPVQLVSPDTAALLSKIYNQTLSRTYVNATGERIMLSVAYGGDQSDATRAHLPEVCYPAQGFQIVSRSEGSVDTNGQQMRVRRLVAKQGSRNEPISYWITVGQHIALSGTELKLAQLSYTVRGVVPDGMLIRISSIDPQDKRAYALHDLFLRDMVGAMTPEARGLTVGSRVNLPAGRT